MKIPLVLLILLVGVSAVPQVQKTPVQLVQAEIKDNVYVKTGETIAVFDPTNNTLKISRPSHSEEMLKITPRNNEFCDGGGCDRYELSNGGALLHLWDGISTWKLELSDGTFWLAPRNKIGTTLTRCDLCD